MKAAIIPVLALLVAGCNDVCGTPGTMTFYWNFQNSAGTVAGDFGVTPGADTGCGTAGVDTVRITVGGTTEDVPCNGIGNGVPGARLPGFERGTFDYVLQGLRGGEVVFGASGASPVRTCSDTVVEATLQAVSPQSLVVYYDFNGAVPTSCSVANQPLLGIAYQLSDGQQNVLDTTGAIVNGQPGDIPVMCDPQSFGIVLPGPRSAQTALPLGNYRLDYIEAVAQNGTTALRACGVPVAHTGFPVVVDLTTAPGGAACP